MPDAGSVTEAEPGGPAPPVEATPALLPTAAPTAVGPRLPAPTSRLYPPGFTPGPPRGRDPLAGVLPQNVLLVGGMLFLASCLCTLLATAVDLPVPLTILGFCAGPTGFLTLFVGLVLLVTRRGNRRA